MLSDPSITTVCYSSFLKSYVITFKTEPSYRPLGISNKINKELKLGTLLFSAVPVELFRRNCV
jgi:hypothetical protein